MQAELNITQGTYVDLVSWGSEDEFWDENRIEEVKKDVIEDISTLKEMFEKELEIRRARNRRIAKVATCIPCTAGIPITGFGCIATSPSLLVFVPGLILVAVGCSVALFSCENESFGEDFVDGCCRKKLDSNDSCLSLRSRIAQINEQIEAINSIDLLAFFKTHKVSQENAKKMLLDSQIINFNENYQKVCLNEEIKRDLLLQYNSEPC